MTGSKDNNHNTNNKNITTLSFFPLLTITTKNRELPRSTLPTKVIQSIPQESINLKNGVKLVGLARSPYLKCGNFVLEVMGNRQQTMSIQLKVKFILPDTPFCLRVEVLYFYNLYKHEMVGSPNFHNTFPPSPPFPTSSHLLPGLHRNN